VPIIQKQNAMFQARFVTQVEGGFLLPKGSFKEDEDGNAVFPGPNGQGATIIKAGHFGITEDGSLRIAEKFVNTATPGIILVSGEILLIDPNACLMVPNRLIPSCRTVIARERGADRNLLIKCHGGVGDVVCAEPAVRFALNRFPEEKISLCTDYPEFFQHLKFAEIFPASGENQPKYRKFLVFQNFSQGDELAWEFVAHPLMHAVDYASLNMWRLILPNSLKRVILQPTEKQISRMIGHFPLGFFEQPMVVIHPGKTWDSRTFPKKWWDTIISGLKDAGIMPVIIGGNVDKQKDGSYRAGTVDVETDGCIDLRYKLDWGETVALLQATSVLLTNDSSPLHIAASGDAFIGFVSTVKHADHLLHHRRGGLGWRMKDFAKDTLFNQLNFCPNQEKEIHVDKVHVLDLLKMLPEPTELVDWTLSKLKGE